jgi:peptidyl-prolyl cis-trans isomerase D
MLDNIRRNAQGWGVKLIFGLIIIVFVFWGVGSFTGDGGKVVAYVDDDPITLKEFQETYTRAMDNVRRQNPNMSQSDIQDMDLARQVLFQMVDTRLLDRKAADLGFTVSDKELREAVTSVEAFHNEEGRFDRQIYEMLLSSQGLTMSGFEAQMRQQLRLAKLQDSVQGTMRATPEQARDIFDFVREKAGVDYILFPEKDYMDAADPAQEDIESYYQENQARFQVPEQISVRYLTITPANLARPEAVSEQAVADYYENNLGEFTSKASVHARHILFSIEEGAGEKAVEEARERAMNTIEELRRGADFAALARERSDGPSASRGGDLGWFTAERMVEPFSEAAFSLEPGEISQPVRTRFGFHVIKVLETRPAESRTLEEAAPEIRKRLAADRAADQLADTLDNVLDRVLSGDSLEATATDLNLPLGETDLFSRGRFPAGLGLDPQDEQPLFELAVGEVTDMPLEIDNGYLLAEKIGEKPAHVRPLEDVRPDIVTTLARRQAAELALEDAGRVLDTISQSGLGPQYAARLRPSQPFTRQGVIPELGSNPELTRDAFATPEGEWLPRAYKTGQGALVARTSERIRPGDEKWTEEKDFWRSTLERNLKSGLFQSFVASLRDQANIQIVNQQMFR